MNKKYINEILLKNSQIDNFVKSVKKVSIDIKEDENNDLILTPKLDDLPTEYSNLYEKNIQNKFI